MLIRYSIRFLLRTQTAGKPPADETAGLRMRVYIYGVGAVDFAVGVGVLPSDWDKDAGRARTNKEANRAIDEYTAVAKEIFNRFELLEKRIPTRDEFKALFLELSGRTPTADADERSRTDALFEEYISTVSVQNSWTLSTLRKVKTVRRHFLASRPPRYINELTEEDLQRFVSRLLRKGMRNTTVAKDYAFVRWFLSWASKKGYYTGNVHQTFKPRLKGTDGNAKEIIYLTLSEMERLRACEIPASKTYLEQTRDVFLFCCYTSLRYSDVAALTVEDVKEGYIQVVTQKTSDGLKIELNRHAQAIIDKYRGKRFRGSLALPVISNQKMNDYLKELGQMAGLDEPTRIVYFKGDKRFDEYHPKWELLTTHCARRTFVVTALQLGIPVEVIIRWTGHSSYEAMKPYVAIVDDLKKREMNKFNLL